MTDIIMADADDPLSISGSDVSSDYSSPPTLPPILRLPAELRERILVFCLKNDRPISWPSPEQGPHDLPVSLLHTCKKIYEQAAVMLYEQNVLLFRHPSDCNMFLYMYNFQLAQKSRRLLLHITDREVSLWTAYLSSTSQHRSLMHDYPNLEELYIVLRSSISLGSPHHNLLEAYKKWQYSKALLNLCGSLNTRANKFRIKLLFVRLASKADADWLQQECPEEFVTHPEKTPGPRLRTVWQTLQGCEVALDATVEDNPWVTGELF